MLWRYLPELDDAAGSGWTRAPCARRSEFVQQLLEVHNAPPTIHWPHRHLIRLASLRLRDPDLQAALQAGCTFDPERELPLDAEPTPPTRIADYVPRAPEPEPIVGAEADRVASTPMPLGETRREPTAEPVVPKAPADLRREPVVAAPTPSLGGWRESTPASTLDVAAGDAERHRRQRRNGDQRVRQRDSADARADKDIGRGGIGETA